MNDRLTSFLYMLVRDHVPVGVVNDIIAFHLPSATYPHAVTHTDHLLEAWAREAAWQINSSSSITPQSPRRAEMFCTQCDAFVRILAAPDHLTKHPDHTLLLRWYPQPPQRPPNRDWGSG